MNKWKAANTHYRKLKYVQNSGIFNCKGSNEILQVAGNYDKWQQDMDHNMKNKSYYQ